MSLRALAFLAAMATASCAPGTLAPQAARAAATGFADTLPPLRRFTGAPTTRLATPANAQLARDFLALTFQLETGRQLDTFTRFEGPVTLAVELPAGAALPPMLMPDLGDLVGRLRREARIDVTMAVPGEMASITISVLPREVLRREVRGAACFVVPRVSGWADYLARRDGDATDWATLTTRTRASVFLPADVSPQEIRDCLHEELAQALGPLNDLYRLPDSVFNDDNMHVALTSWDMLVLRATYDPELRSGMSRADVAAAIPGILARLNPRGRGMMDRGAVPEATPDWVRAIQTALSPDASDRARLSAAQRAVALAREAGWRDTRLALSELALGRAALPSDGDLALTSFLAAGSRYRALAGEGIGVAQVQLQLAAFAVSSGEPAGGLALLDRAIPTAMAEQDAALLATLLLIRAEALTELGRPDEAVTARREGFGWGRYAFGDALVGLRAQEVAGLRPQV